MCSQVRPTPQRIAGSVSSVWSAVRLVAPKKALLCATILVLVVAERIDFNIRDVNRGRLTCYRVAEPTEIFRSDDLSWVESTAHKNRTFFIFLRDDVAPL